MNEIKENIILASLWHDVGKVVRRSGEAGEHSKLGEKFLKQKGFKEEIVRACRLHHGKFLSSAQIDKNDISYIVYIADNISASADRRDIEGDGQQFGFDEHTPLKSVFNVLNNHNDNKGYKLDKNSVNTINFPLPNLRLTNGDYLDIMRILSRELSGTFDYTISSSIELCESTMSFIPSCTAKGDLNDISLYDHSKITAGVASCIYDYLEDKKEQDYKKVLFDNEKEFMNENCFILASIDTSGIQKFIYNMVGSKNALKQLRARSTYLDVSNEYLVDDILDELECSKANLIYNGGGHSYLLLPNTEIVKNKFEKIIKKHNRWLLDHFRETIYVSYGYVECSPLDLTNQHSDGINHYGNMFRKLSQELSKKKIKRYTVEEIMYLNNLPYGDGERECALCGISSNLIKEVTDGKEVYHCPVCSSLTKFGKNLIDDDLYFVFTEKKLPDYENVPFDSYSYDEVYLQLVKKDDLLKMYHQDIAIVRVYGKSSFNMGHKYYGNIYCGSYAAKDVHDIPKSFDNFEEESEGIKRIAVFRGDVDNLGLTFRSGFRQKDNYMYETLSRTATLSKKLSQFFKFYINELFDDEYKKYSDVNLFGTVKKNRNLSIIYSGGDDICLVGSWDDVIMSAIDLKKQFAKYCNDTMTLSGGIGIYKSGYPISRMSVETGELESLSKNYQDNETKKLKNAITLFSSSGENTYSWNDLEDGVINKKLHYIENYFSKTDENQEGGGKSFIYRLIELLRNNDKAKVAYLLGRLLKKDDDTNSINSKFINQIYEWSKDDSDRKQLITALILYVYSIRED